MANIASGLVSADKNADGVVAERHVTDATLDVLLKSPATLAQKVNPSILEAS